MRLQKVWDYFEASIFPITSENSLFNPYNGVNLDLDIENADQIRRQNLRMKLSCYKDYPSILLLGEAPGKNGCRFSGIPFTSEYQLTSNILPFQGAQSSKFTAVKKEPSATVFWKNSISFFPDFFVWNCIPFHPHNPGQPMSNRTPSGQEIMKYIGLLDGLVKTLKAKKIVSIGNSASCALTHLGVPFDKVRHPAFGGAQKFSAGIKLFLSEVK